MNLFANIMLFILISTSAFAMGGDHGGNGGGGVKKNGRYMTFYTAGLYTEPQPLDGTGADSPPGVDAFISFVQKFNYWSPSDKSTLMTTALPSDAHQYFRVKEDQFTPETMERLISEFNRVTQQPTVGLEIFAVTDLEKRQTFLLPQFYDLSPEDQIAIIFHETYWMVKGPNADYHDVVSAEMAFEAVYMQPNNGQRILDLISKFGDGRKMLAAMAKADTDSGALIGLMAKDGTVQFSDILGEDLLNCSADNCVEGMVTINLYHLVQRYPKSLLLARLYKQTQSGDAVITDRRFSREVTLKSWTSKRDSQCTLNFSPEKMSSVIELQCPNRYDILRF